MVGRFGVGFGDGKDPILHFDTYGRTLTLCGGGRGMNNINPYPNMYARATFGFRPMWLCWVAVWNFVLFDGCHGGATAFVPVSTRRHHHPSLSLREDPRHAIKMNRVPSSNHKDDQFFLSSPWSIDRTRNWGSSSQVPPPIASFLSSSSSSVAFEISSTGEEDENSLVITEEMQKVQQESIDYANSMDVASSCRDFDLFYALFRAIRNQRFVPLKIPFVLRQDQVQSLTWSRDKTEQWAAGFFSMEHLEHALEDDFLDAARGSTDNRKGWKVRFDNWNLLTC